MLNRSGVSCVTSDMIIDLIKAEHDQVRQRTDIIKQLIDHDCGFKNEKKSISPLVIKHTGTNSISTLKKSFPKYGQPRPINNKNSDQARTGKSFAKSEMRSKNRDYSNLDPIQNEQDTKAAKKSENEMEICELLREISALRNIACKYEKEKIDWIGDKRNQIKILQKLRDASCEETKAAMKLTDWNVSNSQNSEKDCEKAKACWIECKQKQINLLEELRSITLREIEKSMCTMTAAQKLLTSAYSSNNKTNPNQSKWENVYSNDLLNVSLCSNDFLNGNPNSKDSKCNINISINPKQFDPCSNQQFPNISETENTNRFPCTSPNLPFYNCDDRAESTNKGCITMQENLLIKMRNSIINRFGARLFDGTYQMMKKLQCPELILDIEPHDNTSSDLFFDVYNFIKAERCFIK